MYMVFFVAVDGSCTRTEPLAFYDEAIDAAKRGPSGANFEISNISDPDNWYIVTSGIVA